MDAEAFHQMYNYNLTSVVNLNVPLKILCNVASFNKWRRGQNKDDRLPGFEAHMFYYNTQQAALFLTSIPFWDEDGMDTPRLVALTDALLKPPHPDSPIPPIVSCFNHPRAELRWLFEDLDRLLCGRRLGAPIHPTPIRPTLRRERPLQMVHPLKTEDMTAPDYRHLWTFRFTSSTDFRSFFAANGSAAPGAMASRDSLDKLFENYRGRKITHL